MAKSPTRHKHAAQRIHFKRRLKERYGFEINRETYSNIIESIQTARPVPGNINGVDVTISASYYTKQTNRVRVYLLKVHGYSGEIPVAYDSQRGELITAHPEMTESHRNAA